MADAIPLKNELGLTGSDLLLMSGVGKDGARLLPPPPPDAGKGDFWTVSLVPFLSFLVSPVKPEKADEFFKLLGTNNFGNSDVRDL